MTKYGTVGPGENAGVTWDLISSLFLEIVEEIFLLFASIIQMWRFPA